jgi:hypothetical protein
MSLPVECIKACLVQIAKISNTRRKWPRRKSNYFGPTTKKD